ncbi:hypothetical protein EVJ50_09505 [Synechococcus sp. RSCCF101]|uniref:hypothetical protein n=1 Tax=Synechococcus sp. RSCCF101 TaxID=2511069 RepID=UPI001245B31C|nr:hypothetical protein [Synechococcus sp. RSCCF101]QEY32417.1 hypothetical protein EVJ50_09505 [Synechococcus sp. RSCCF101]
MSASAEADARAFRAELHLRRLSANPYSRALVQHAAAVVEHTRNGPDADHRAYPLFQPGRDQHTPYHRAFYAHHPDVASTFADLCRQVLRDLIGEPAYVQVIPTYRIGFPDNRWVGSFHRDSDFGHSPYELNVVCGLTPMHDTAALHVENRAGSRDFEPMNLEAGELVMFDHIDRLHGCPINKENTVVASIDFRFVPLRFAEPAFAAAARSINAAVAFLPGQYFSPEPLTP